jgi:hypothetical protein
VARRDIALGEELTHPYTQNASNKALYTRFGFVVKDNPADRVPLPAHLPRFAPCRIQSLLNSQQEAGTAGDWSARAIESLSYAPSQHDQEAVDTCQDVDEEHEHEQELLLVLYIEVAKQLSVLQEREGEASNLGMGYLLGEYLEQRILLLQQVRTQSHSVTVQE